MFLIDTLNLPGTSVPSQDQLNQGQLKLPENRLMKGLRLIFAGSINNTSGGAVSLTDAEKRALLDAFEFNVSYGNKRSRRVFVAVRGDRMRREQRFAYGNELEGYNNTTDGLGRSFPNGASTAFRFTLIVPLGEMKRLEKSIRKLFGMGQTQANTLEVQVRRISNPTLRANVVLDSAVPVTIQMEPHLEATEGDVWGLVPEYRELELAKDRVTFDGFDGLPLRLSERTAAADASTLTNISVKIDDDQVVDQRPVRSITELYRDDPYETTSSFVGDLETVLYQPQWDSAIEELNTGIPEFAQNGVRVIVTPLLSILYVPYFEADAIRKEVANIANIKQGNVVCSSADLWAGRRASKRHQGLPAWQIFKVGQDREAKSRPGIAAAVGGEGKLYLPPFALDAARGARARFASAGDNEGAANVVKELAAIIPGGVPGGRGFARGDSTIFREVAASLG